MRALLLQVLPRRPPGPTQREMMDAMGARKLPAQFPGTTHGWWAKTVQLDLETKGVVVRESVKPLRWHRA